MACLNNFQELQSNSVALQYRHLSLLPLNLRPFPLTTHNPLSHVLMYHLKYYPWTTDIYLPLMSPKCDIVTLKYSAIMFTDLVLLSCYLLSHLCSKDFNGIVKLHSEMLVHCMPAPVTLGCFTCNNNSSDLISYAVIECTKYKRTRDKTLLRCPACFTTSVNLQESQQLSGQSTEIVFIIGLQFSRVDEDPHWWWIRLYNWAKSCPLFFWNSSYLMSSFRIYRIYASPTECTNIYNIVQVQKTLLASLCSCI